MVKLAEVGVLSLGGVLGVNARYWLSQWIGRGALSQFPWATFAVNVTGSFAAGFAATVFARSFPQPAARLFVISGFLGGYTTYSAFALESIALFERGERAVGVTYTVATLVGGLAAVVLGVALARAILPDTGPSAGAAVGSAL